MKYRFERRLRIFGQMIGLGVRRKLASGNVGFEGLYGLRDQRRRVSVTPNELGGRAERQVDQIVEDQHLAIAIGAAPMPIVGVSTSEVIMAATSRGMPSR